eukprot:CAMPEP_0114479322 /NCGR_PEP_ID=MMETSP0104-20121206/16495_1 /TAXON_ID=37642 ORGANISM="Paraphysomonas imperforata, Strain PA2" /NCGR_SAMPLE_ID=MMETSP0104 /ASSEMBLY_ACC=CAM_ASM_000202 /LENGTH=71 /DNA_ID=CAMNT_0001654649 /DNA_START=51 /DNA_END=262 /DNA_ORIENTATION=-
MVDLKSKALSLIYPLENSRQDVSEDDRASLLDNMVPLSIVVRIPSSSLSLLAGSFKQQYDGNVMISSTQTA